MKKLLSMLIVGLFTAVGSFASADTLEITTDGNAYVPAEITFSDWTTLDEGMINNITCNASICLLHIQNGNSYCGLMFSKTPSFQKDCMFAPGTYTLTKGKKHDFFSSVVLSASTIVVSGNDENGGSDSDNLLNPGVISSGVQSGVSAFLSGFGGLIPMILMLGLPIIILTIFWNRIWSYIKHIFVVDKPRGDDIANCNLTLNKYGQFEHHVIGQRDHGDYVDIPGVGLVGKDELPYYVDENLNFKYKEYKQDHELL